jgi:hypothetical protein
MIFWGIRSTKRICCKLKQQELNNPPIEEDDLNTPEKWIEYLHYTIYPISKISHSRLLSFLTHAKPSPEYHKYIQSILSIDTIRESLISHGFSSDLEVQLLNSSIPLYKTLEVLIDPLRLFKNYCEDYVTPNQATVLDKSFLHAVSSTVLLQPLSTHSLNALGSISLYIPIPVTKIMDLIGRFDTVLDLQIKALLIVLLGTEYDSLHLELNVYAMVAGVCAGVGASPEFVKLESMLVGLLPYHKSLIIKCLSIGISLACLF